MPQELTADQVRAACDPGLFQCDSTLELAPKEGIIGQDRALKALEFGLNIQKPGFNVFVSGTAGTGRNTAIQGFLEMLAARKAPPPDWCYVYNFRDAYYPRAIKLPTGMGLRLQKDMKRVIESAQRSLTQAFASKEYADRRAKITEEFTKRRDAVFEEIAKKALDRGLLLRPTPAGLVLLPATKEGEPISEEAYRKLPAKDKEELKKSQEELSRELKEQIARFRAEEQKVEQQIEDVDREVAKYSIGHLFEELRHQYRELPQVVSYLEEVEKDIVENFAQFKAEPKTDETDFAAALQGIARHQMMHKYEVNVVVDNSELKGAPVIMEVNPTFNNLFGRIEKEAQFGALYADFTMIKGGSMHQANGGYLVLRIEDLLSNFQSWEGLKRTIRDGKLVIEELGERLGFMATKSLRPEPIPLDIKIVVVGEPMFYYLLFQMDSDFKELFKVKADFDTRMERTEANLRDYAGVICRMVQEEGLLHLKSDALAKIMEHSSRLAGDQEKLSTLFADIADIIREAGFWAASDGKMLIEADHIRTAIEEKIYRSDLIHERISEMIGQGTIFIDTKGEKVGQINGLEVLALGDFAFGKPSRITASVGVGREGIIDIEREAKLGGPLHTKGVMILNGYIAEKYGGDFPLSLSARLVFEQSYEEIDGDSASSAELYTILSRLAEVPVKQSLAVTGSVNQRGEVQAIGGVNEKIEGFFEIARLKGLNGQGVLIPASNVRHLMLKEEVVEAVRKGQFHIYSAATIDEGLEVLTGLKAGKRLKDGSFEKGSVNDRVQKRLKTMADKLQQFARPEPPARERRRSDNGNNEKKDEKGKQ